MRKILLASTAAAVALGIGAGPAHADLEATLGGRLLTQFAFWDYDPADNDRDIRNDLEIHVDVEATSDAGLTYGFNVELQNSSGNNFSVDEASIFLQGIWGKLEIGDQDGAVEKLQVFAPSYGEELGIDGDELDLIKAIGFNPGQGGVFRGNFDGEVMVFQALESSDSSKIIYRTPKFSGFQAAISYAPENDTPGDEGTNLQATDPGAGGPDSFQDFVELAAKYEGQFQNVGVTLGAAYSLAETTSPGFEDVGSYNIGANLSWGGFTFGGAWIDWGDSGMPSATDWESDGWNIGLAYQNGPFQVGTNYSQSTFADVEYDMWEIGGQFDIAKGLFVNGEVAWFNQEDDAAAGVPEDDGFLIFVQTGVKF